LGDETVIRANCRERFTANDFNFIVAALAKKEGDVIPLSSLLVDKEMRDELLDHSALFDAVLGQKGYTAISPFLYFYVLTRRALRSFGMDDRRVADYVASLLAEFSSMKRARAISHDHERQYDYLVDMLTDLLDASSQEAFLLRSHIGNYSLFLTGVFPDYVYRRSTYGRKSPGFEYYETLGSMNYRIASGHWVAQKYELSEILCEIADCFRRIRRALNRLSDQYIKLDTRQQPSLDKTLRQILFGPRSDRTPKNFS